MTKTTIEMVLSSRGLQTNLNTSRERKIHLGNCVALIDLMCCVSMKT
jgi:hypothetical protein